MVDNEVTKSPIDDHKKNKKNRAVKKVLNLFLAVDKSIGSHTNKNTKPRVL